MFDNVVDVLGRLRPVVAELDVKALDPEAAGQLVELLVEVEQLAAAGRVLATRAVERGDRWLREGFRSAAAWMAAQTGTPVGPALATMKMARLLDGLPVVAAAFRAGRLSEVQAKEIVEAAAECPDAEQQLVDAADKLSLAELREECRRVKASVITDEDDRHRRIHKGRYLRSWTDRDGAVRLDARLTADEGARLLAEVDARRDDMIADALRGRWYENPDAHRADALVDLARTAGGSGAVGPEAMVHVWVDYEALMRGSTLEGERCEIPGLGPIPVALARRMAEDCILKVVVTKGVEITAVAHGGRTIPAHLRTALECRDPTCIVPQCEMRRGLEIDHRDPWAATRDTRLANLARLCRWHHYQKSHLGYRYRGGPGTWEWIPPDDIPMGTPRLPP
ncbi:MAG: HNH endonuclease [Actinomycetota bacterium]|nr:HNH endonuclease [Actinomycetota bacterium]